MHRLTFFVSEGENAFAVCYALLTPSHPHDPVKFAVSIGEWGGEEETEFYPSRCCFTIWGRVVDGSWEFMARDAEDSPWNGHELLTSVASLDFGLDSVGKCLFCLHHLFFESTKSDVFGVKWPVLAPRVSFEALWGAPRRN